MSIERRYPLLKHAHDAADITSGTFAPGLLGSGVADNSKFLRGDSTWNNTLNGAFTANGVISAVPPGGGESIRLIANNGYISFWNSTNTTRTGYIQYVVSDAVYHVAENAGNRFIWQASGEKMRLDTSALHVTGQVRATGWYGSNAAVGGPGVEIGYSGGGQVIAYDRNAGAYQALNLAGTTHSLTATTGGFIFNFGNSAFTGTNVVDLVNSSSIGQTPLNFIINGTLRGKVRSDYAGNLTLVANGGNLDVFIGGDSGTGTLAARLDTTFMLNTPAGGMAAQGWGNNPSGHSTKIGVSSGISYLQCYNSSTATYKDLYITANTAYVYNGSLEVGPGSGSGTLTMGGKVTVNNANDNWLRLNNSSQYSNGVYTPGLLRADGGLSSVSGVIQTGGDIYAGGGYRYQADTSFYIYNTSGGAYTYGSWRIGGNLGGNGYNGLIFDLGTSGRKPTIMYRHSDGLGGIYFQGTSTWCFYDDATNFNVNLPIKVLSSGAAYIKHGSLTSGVITVQSGGSASGGSDGDIFLIY